MKKIILTAAIAFSISASAQNNTVSNLIDGSKAFVELVRVFKTPKTAMYTSSLTQKAGDSCASKGISDLCIKNSTGKILIVSLFKRNGNIYEPTALMMRVLPKNKEWLYELKSGVYKMKLETEEEGVKKPFREGEIKINSCDNPVQDIKDK